MPGFGENGVVDLMARRARGGQRHTSIGNSSPALVIGDVVVVGPAHEVGMRPPSKSEPEGRRARLRRAHREAALDLPHDSRRAASPVTRRGSTARPSHGQCRRLGGDGADPELGFVYLPVEAPLADIYGGERPGNNLYGNSLVCVDAKTGEVVWHYQLIHHDIWDWDNPTAPILMDIVVDGQPDQGRRADHEAGLGVYVRSRHRRTGLADRGATGAGRRRAGRTDVADAAVPDEAAARSTGKGVTEDDLIDFTPALRAEAIEGTKVFRMGPIFTPASLANAADGTHGTLMLPHATGGANWEGGAFDPETNVLYVGSFTNPFVAALEPRPKISTCPTSRAAAPRCRWLQGLPLDEAALGRITAIDMNKGEHLWQMPNGPTPKEIAEHPALKGLESRRRAARRDPYCS